MSHVMALLPSKFLAADHALVRPTPGPIGPVGKCHVFVGGLAANTKRLQPQQN